VRSLRAGYESKEVGECQELLEDVFENVSRRYEGMTGGLQGWTVEDENEVEYRINLDGDDIVVQYTFDSF
jgi:hypothetical protein